MTMSNSMRVAAVALVSAFAASACAQTGPASGENATDEDWPAGETMTLIVGYEAGGTTDTMARALAKKLEEELDAQIQVVNQDGAGGQRAYTELANAEPDGLTFGTVNYPTILSTIVDKSKGATFTLDDFQLVANHVNDPRVTIVHPDSQFKTAEDLVTYAKENPRELTGATSGLSGGGHFSMLKLEEATGADFAPVHFNDGQADASAAFLGDHVDVYFASIGDGLEIIRSGEGRPVGVAAQKRNSLLPDVPTYKEQGIDIEEAGMRGYALPAGVPKERLDILSDAMRKIITSEVHQTELRKLSLQSEYMGPAAYKDWLMEQMPTVEHFTQLSKTDQ